MKVKYRGVPFEDGDDILIVPPLNCAQLRDLAATLKQHDDIKIPEATNGDIGATMEAVGRRRDVQVIIVHAALTRNYPDITVQKVEEVFDGRTLGQAWQAAIGINNSGQPWVRDSGEMTPVSVTQT
jgi:hypothetical protein